MDSKYGISMENDIVTEIFQHGMMDMEANVGMLMAIPTAIMDFQLLNMRMVLRSGTSMEKDIVIMIYLLLKRVMPDIGMSMVCIIVNMTFQQLSHYIINRGMLKENDIEMVIFQRLKWRMATSIGVLMMNFIVMGIFLLLNIQMEVSIGIIMDNSIEKTISQLL